MSFHKSGRNDTENPGGSVSPIKETTLGEYINRKLRNEAFDTVNNERKLVTETAPKLTFEEWYEKAAPWRDVHLPQIQVAKLIWNAAQENV